ncbi:MAG TPA: hypothetical protein VIX19_02790, partial [Terriglobales bacterium]
RPATFLPAVLTAIVSFAIAGCGGTAMTNGVASSARELESMAVTPAAPDAQAFPNSQVQFMATGMFNMAPTSVMSMQVMWSVGNPPFMSPTPMPMSMSSSMSGAAMPTISANGMAQCNGFVGIATIEATAPANPNTPLSQMNSMMSVVTGRANLTCP